MPSFTVDPMPVMDDQRISPRFLPNFMIYPQCGRYCLKALLRHHYESLVGAPPPPIHLPHARNFLARHAGYDPSRDFQYGAEGFARDGEDLLVEVLDDGPDTVEGWIDLLQTNGPVIISGAGVGHAGMVGHYILIVGVDGTGADGTFVYKDPLRGDAQHQTDFAALKARINDHSYARDDIGQHQARFDILRGFFADD